ncbi:cupin domain-containing protein [Pelagerythrobacter sp.]|uniref:cupin domain-containing protein n=1 Tax=Pelagerythrobacter sp. TaxID=2800702 RepID=UPI0035AFD70C
MTALAKLETPLAPVRTADVDWEVLGTHGLRRKRLGHDVSTGHVTFLLDIPRGWHGGGVAHYHEGFEEVLMLSGSVTLDGQHHWHGGDYFYRPAHVVHGLAESSQEGARALVRCDRMLELLLVPEPERSTEYPLPGQTDPRGHVFSVKVDDIPAECDPAFPREWKIKSLSRDPQTGARTFMTIVPPGWTGSAPAMAGDWEAFVLDGDVAGAAHRYGDGDYTVGSAADGLLAASASERGATVMVWMFDGAR